MPHMHCPACQTPNPDGTLECTACGTGLRQACPACAAPCDTAARFCSACGQRLQQPPETEAPQTWGQIKPATILFADIAGSTEHIAALDPEQAMQQLQPAIERMVATIEAHGGSVLRTLGDGVMALFGVPLAQEHHAQQACHAALALQTLSSATQAGSDVMLRVGLHSGKVASDPTEAGDRRGGGAHGVSIHLASRVCAQAQPGQVLLTAATLEALQQAFAVESLGHWHLKGIVDPIELFSLLADAPVAEKPASLVAASTPFVGRAAELRRLMQLLERAQRGQGSVLTVTGEAGAGKSRLCAEFAAHCATQGVAVHAVRGYAYGQVAPMEPMVELVRSGLLGVGPEMSVGSARQRIESALARVHHLEPSDADLLASVLGIGSAVNDAGTPPRAQPGRFRALVSALVRDAAAPCRVLIVEDLHWLDASSRALLNVIASGIDQSATLLICNSRTSPPSEWAALTHASHLTLGGLHPDHVRQLLGVWRASSLERLAGLSADALDGLVLRSHGNPLFAEELARHVVQGGGVDTLPDSIEAMVGARLDALEDELKTVLTVAAVMGQRIDKAVLARVLGQAPGQLEHKVQTLCDRSVLARTGGGHQLAFRHPLLQEVAYGSQLRARRREIHARVASALEAASPETSPRPAEHAWLLAHHHEQAGQRLQAARYAADAANLLTHDNAQEIAQRWSKVLALLDKVDDPAAKPLRALAAGRVVYLGWQRGMPLAEVDRLIQQALDDAHQIDPRLPQLLLFAQARLVQSNGGSADDYVRALRRLLDMPSPAGDPGRRITLLLALCQALGWAGLLREALAANDEVLNGLHLISAFDQNFIGFDVQRWCLALRVRLMLRLGRQQDSVAPLTRLQALGVNETDPVIRHMICAASLEFEIARGLVQHVDGRIEDLERMASAATSTYVQIANDYFRGVGAMARQRYEHALTCLQRGLLTLRVTQVAAEFEAELLAFCADAYWALRRLDELRTYALELARVANRRGNRVAECRANIHLARWATATDSEVIAIDLTGDQALSRARDLLSQTGADSLRPAVRSVQSATERRRKTALELKPGPGRDSSLLPLAETASEARSPGSLVQGSEPDGHD